MRPDSEIASSIANMLKWHIPLEAEKISIKVENGIVTLEGMVNWDFQRQAVEEAVRCQSGVVRLDNFIDLNITGSRVSADRLS